MTKKTGKKNNIKIGKDKYKKQYINSF